MTARARLVRYVSPFGTPAWMPRDVAERHLEVDDARYVEWSRLGILPAFALAIGAPRIELPPR